MRSESGQPPRLKPGCSPKSRKTEPSRRRISSKRRRTSSSPPNDSRPKNNRALKARLLNHRGPSLAGEFPKRLQYAEPKVRIQLLPARSPLRNLMPTISAQPAEVADPPPKTLSPLQECAHVRDRVGIAFQAVRILFGLQFNLQPDAVRIVEIEGLAIPPLDNFGHGDPMVLEPLVGRVKFLKRVHR